MVRDPHTGKYRRTRLFVMTLGYSRKSVRLVVFHSNSRVWAELHEQSFRHLGGATRVVVLDNLREGVLGSSGILCVNGSPLGEGMKAPAVFHRLSHISQAAIG